MRIIQTTEDEPASRPTLDVQNPDVVWARLESWCKYRWGVRTITSIVENPEVFRPPILPAALVKSELWDGAGWIETDGESWLGGAWYPRGVWQLTYSVGATTAKPEVIEAANERPVQPHP